jgi:hypothetical protein
MTNITSVNSSTGTITYGGVVSSQSALPSANSVPTGTTYTNLSSGTVYINAGTNWNSINTMSPASYSQPTFSGHATFNTSDGKSTSVDELVMTVEMLKKRLLILQPCFEKHEQYPALKEAYEHYLLIERMCCGDDKPTE